MILIHGHRGMRSPHRGVSQSVTGSSVTAIPARMDPCEEPASDLRRSAGLRGPVDPHGHVRGECSRSRSEPLDMAGITSDPGTAAT